MKKLLNPARTCAFALGAILFASCSKDKGDDPKPGPDPVKTVTVGAQQGAATAGKVSKVTFTVTTENIADGKTPALTWYTSAAGTTAAEAPEHIEPSPGGVSKNSVLVTMTSGAKAAAGDYFFKVTIDGATSATAKLTVGEEPANALKGTAWLRAWPAGEDGELASATIDIASNREAAMSTTTPDGATVAFPGGTYTLDGNAVSFTFPITTDEQRELMGGEAGEDELVWDGTLTGNRMSLYGGDLLFVKRTGDATQEYFLYARPDAHGRAGATVDGAEAETAIAGATVTLLATPDEGYAFRRWTVRDGGMTLSPDVATNPATFKMPAAHAVVGAEFTTGLTFTDNAAFDIPALIVETAIANIDVATGVSGGTKPYTFSATGLPAGIVISKAGVISGTPTAATAAGMAYITVKDATTPSAQSRQISIHYGTVTPTLAFEDRAAFDIPASTVGTAIASIYNISTAVSGGTKPYTFTATGLPAGIIIIPSSGVIAGTPTAAAPAGYADITVTDATAPAAQSKSITIAYGTVTPALVFTDYVAFDIPASFTYTTIANIDVATAASGGTKPYTFTATGLPTGITISTAGVISGQPTEVTAAGTATITVKDATTPTAHSRNISIAYGAVTPGGTTGPLTWKLTGDGTLSITGTGAIPDYTSEAPWYTHREAIKTVVIGNGVTTIGSKAFVRCYALTEITIPNSVTSIKDEAVRECYALTEITIPAGVKTIEAFAFMYCHDLKTVTCLATVPPTFSATYNFIASDDTLYVPAGSLAAYQNSLDWSRVFSSIEAIP